MRLLRYPNVAKRSCELCQLYWYDEETGFINRASDGKTLLTRDRTCQPPCRTRFGCIKGTPEAPLEMSKANEMCYEHYLQCRAIGVFPNADPIMMENAAIIRRCYDKFEAEERRKIVDDVKTEFKDLTQMLVAIRQ